MYATALRGITQAVTSQGTGTTSAAGTITSPGPSTGGGPVPAPSQPMLMGVRLLPAPFGQPQPIHLADGTFLVPFARVRADGRTLPLSVGGSAGTASASTTATAVPTPVAPTATPAPAAAPATVATPAPATMPTPAAAPAPAATPEQPAPAAVLAPSPPAVQAAAPNVDASAPVVGAGPRFEPKGFLYNDRYFAKFHPAAPIDLASTDAVERRAAKATMSYLVEEEPNVDDFGITAIRMRRADPVADRDLLTVNPRAHWIIDVDGVDGLGQVRSIPSVMNDDGAVFVDPRIGRT